MKRLLTIVSLVFIIANPLWAQQTYWQRTYGAFPYNEGSDALEMRDKGYLFLENEGGDFGNSRIRLIKTDSLGLIIWQQNPGSGKLNHGSKMTACSDHGYLITGYTYNDTASAYDLLLIKTDSAGQTLWERSLGGQDWDFGQSIAETPDSGILVVGKTYSYGHGDADAWILKFNHQGDTLWTRCFGGDSLDYAADCGIAADSNYWVAMNTSSFGKGKQDAWILKMNDQGDTLMSRLYGDSLRDEVNSMHSMPDKGLVFVGSTMNFGAVQNEIWLMRLDSNMNLMWKLPEFWNVGPGNDVATHVDVNDSMQYVISGYTNGAGAGGNDYILCIMAEWNNFRYSATYGTLAEDLAYCAFQTSDKGYLIAGNSNEAGPGNMNLMVIKTIYNCHSDTSVIHTLNVNETNNTRNNSSIRMHPNPANDLLFLEPEDNGVHQSAVIRIYDATGLCVYQSSIQDLSSEKKISISISNYAAGLYFVSVTTEDNLSVQKLIIY
jgi:hypothetical protein